MLTWDLETHRFGPGNLAPKPVCMSVCDHDDKAFVVATCESHFRDVLEECLKSEMANMNIAFDMAVVLAHFPEFRSLIFDAYDAEAVYDIAVREKLLTLARTGDLEYATLKSGSKVKLEWKQSSLEKRLLGIDRTSEKEDEDAWRKNYDVLDGRPASDYPEEAYRYALEDAINAKKIFLHQQARAEKENIDVLRAQHLSTRAAFSLYLSSCWGFAIDKPAVDELLAEMTEQWKPDAVKVVDGVTLPRYGHLLDAGILEPEVPSKPYGNQLARAERILGCRPLDWLQHREVLEAEGIKFTNHKPAKYSDKAKAKRVLEVCKLHDIPIPRTDSWEEGKLEDECVRFDKEAQADLAGFDDALDEYIDRKSIEKLVTTELPGLTSDRCHPRYDILKKTGRTSCFGNSKKDKDPAYPSRNVQQIDPRARRVYIAGEGTVLCSSDYSAIELVSAAQKCISLFGQSTLGEKINQGYDPHAYLGSNIVTLMDPAWRGSSDPDENYQLFLAKEREDEPYFKHYRTLAKPTGLGFWGGLGFKTFIGYAKATYGVDLVKIAGSLEAARDLAKQLKEVWFETYPEARAYFKWVTKHCIDLEFSTHDDQRYAYISPNGMVRRNCFYTEATNGAALQTPTAEGAKYALWEIARAMYDPRAESCLLGSHLVAFIHDECIAELPHDDLTHERAQELARLMVKGMQRVITDVEVKAEPCLMYRWDKKAKPVFLNNRLIPWQPNDAA